MRRFNWFDYPHEDRLQNLVVQSERDRAIARRHGEVHVLRAADPGEQDRGEATGQPLADGAIKTACQQVCPAEAIVFGDLNDPKSRVAQLAASTRAYRVLDELNTRPAVRYLEDRSARLTRGRGF